MAMTNLATAHHQGAGRPSDDPGDMQSKGYCGALLLTRYELWRPPSLAFATLHFNHESFDFVFSGDRGQYPVTPNDLSLLRAMVSDAKGRGWLDVAPYVRPHRETPGNATICPDNHVAYPDPPRFPGGDALAWLAIVSQFHEGTPPVPPTVAPAHFPPLQIVDSCVFTHPTIPGRCFAELDLSGAVFCTPASAYMGGVNTHRTGSANPYFGDRVPALIDGNPAGHGYTIEATDEATYHYFTLPIAP